MRKFFSGSNIIWYALGLVLLVVAIAVATSSHNSAKPQTAQQSTPCGPYRNDKTVQVGGQNIYAEVPSTVAAQAKGLAGRPCILPSQGMLFVFSQPGQHPFWMKGMKFPIDVVWIGEDLKVASIEVDLQPSTYPDGVVNKKENPAKYVLELKANRTKELHISQGSPIKF